MTQKNYQENSSYTNVKEKSSRNTHKHPYITTMPCPSEIPTIHRFFFFFLLHRNSAKRCSKTSRGRKEDGKNTRRWQKGWHRRKKNREEKSITFHICTMATSPVKWEEMRENEENGRKNFYCWRMEVENLWRSFYLMKFKVGKFKFILYVKILKFKIIR